MSDANKAVIRQMYTRLSAGDLNAIDDVLADDFVEHEPVPGLEPTKAGVKQLFGMLHAAFDHATLTVAHMIAEGDKVFALVQMTGIHNGDFMGVPATGRAVSVTLCDFFRVGDDHVVEHWGVMDSAGLMHQLTG